MKCLSLDLLPDMEFTPTVLIMIALIFTHSHLPSDGFHLADQVREFVVSCLWQEQTEKGGHYANCAKNKEWQNLHVQPCKTKESVNHLDQCFSTTVLSHTCVP